MSEQPMSPDEQPLPATEPPEPPEPDAPAAETALATAETEAAAEAAAIAGAAATSGTAATADATATEPGPLKFVHMGPKPQTNDLARTAELVARVAAAAVKPMGYDVRAGSSTVHHADEISAEFQGVVESPSIAMTHEAATLDAAAIVAAPTVPTTQTLIAGEQPIAGTSARRLPRLGRPGLGRASALARAVTPVLILGLFSLGVVGGALLFNSVNRTGPAPAGDPNFATGEPPTVVREFVSALGSNNLDAIRATIGGDPYRLLAGELGNWGYTEVTGVDTLGTVVDGPRTATEIVIHGRDADGVPIVVNLIVHQADGQIVSFR